MGQLLLQSRARRSLLVTVSAVLGSRLLPAQKIQEAPPPVSGDTEDVRLPNGKKQSEEILKADYEKNVKDAQELVGIARSFEEDLEKDDRYVLSLSSLKKLDDIEKLAKKIRSRLKRY